MFGQGLSKGITTSQLARELHIGRQTVHYGRQALQASAQMLQPDDVLPDTVSETDEMFQNAGEKGEPHLAPKDPPRQQGNKRRGHGTYENNRPPVVGTAGRESGLVRLRVGYQTDGATLCEHVQKWTHPTAIVHTDVWRGSNCIDHSHAIVHHGDGEWARDGDGILETPVRTIEGVWTTVRNFGCPFRGVHKKFLTGYIAICEFAMNIKSVTVEFISKLVQRT